MRWQRNLSERRAMPHKSPVRIYKIDGVGINLDRFYPVRSAEEKTALRSARGFSGNDFILIYTAEFIPRKNHKLLFAILPGLKQKIPALKMVLCGKGELLEHYRALAAACGMDYVVFTGYTHEVADFCRLSDVCVSTSLQEGLALNLVEGMACGLPLVASAIRGHCDVVGQFENGIWFGLACPDSFAAAILLLHKNPALRREMGERNVTAARRYAVENSVEAMTKIYGGLILGRD